MLQVLLTVANHDYVVDLVDTPTFIKALGCLDEKIHLIYKRVSPRQPPESFEVTADSNVSPIDLDGSPLVTDLGSDLDCTVGPAGKLWTDAEERMMSMTIDQARYHLNNFVRRFEGHFKTVYAMCDTKNIVNAVAMGISVTDKSCARSRVMYCGLHCDTSPQLTMRYMFHEHWRHLLPMSKEAVKRKVVYDVRNAYDLYGTTIKEYIADQTYSEHGSVGCVVNYDLPSFIIPSHGAKFVTTIQAIVGHEQSEAYGLWNQLNNLHNCYKALEEISVCESPELQKKVVFSNIHKPLNDIHNDIINILEDYGSVYNEDVTEKLETLPDLKNLDKLFPPNFNGRLFNALICCENADDLCMCFYMLLTEAFYVRLRVQVSPANTTRVLNIISDMSHKKVKTVPHLTAFDCVDLLLEMGVLKLWNDYLNVCTLLNIVKPTEFLSEFHEMTDLAGKVDSAAKALANMRLTTIVNSATDIKQYKQRIDFMGKFHTCVELHLLMDKYCVVSIEKRTPCQQQLFDQFLGPNSVIHSFEHILSKRLFTFVMTYPIWDTEEKLDILNGMTSESTRVSLKTENFQFMIESIFHISLKCIFPPSIYSNNVTYDEANSTVCPKYDTDHMYYLTKLIVVKN